MHIRSYILAGVLCGATVASAVDAEGRDEHGQVDSEHGVRPAAHAVPRTSRSILEALGGIAEGAQWAGDEKHPAESVLDGLVGAEQLQRGFAAATACGPLVHRLLQQDEEEKSGAEELELELAEEVARSCLTFEEDPTATLPLEQLAASPTRETLVALLRVWHRGRARAKAQNAAAEEGGFETFGEAQEQELLRNFGGGAAPRRGEWQKWLAAFTLLAVAARPSKAKVSAGASSFLVKHYLRAAANATQTFANATEDATRTLANATQPDFDAAQTFARAGANRTSAFTARTGQLQAAAHDDAKLEAAAQKGLLLLLGAAAAWGLAKPRDRAVNAYRHDAEYARLSRALASGTRFFDHRALPYQTPPPCHVYLLLAQDPSLKGALRDQMLPAGAVHLGNNVFGYLNVDHASCMADAFYQPPLGPSGAWRSYKGELVHEAAVADLEDCKALARQHGLLHFTLEAGIVYAALSPVAKPLLLVRRDEWALTCKVYGNVDEAAPAPVKVGRSRNAALFVAGKLREI